jgi:hypothetical protein
VVGHNQKNNGARIHTGYPITIEQRVSMISIGLANVACTPASGPSHLGDSVRVFGED